MKIAVDAMGGDYGPAVVVEGAAAAAREFGAVVILVGDRAAIEREVARIGAAVVPNLKRFTVLLDVGANVDPKPAHLMQFAVMGHVYARDILGFDNPRVGLLSVGEEEGKGNELTKEAYEQLKESSLNFSGNVEGRDIYNGRCDVVVTDGFTGNVALKISESLAEMFGAMIREELTRDVRSKVGAALTVPAFQRFKRRIDY